LNKFALGALLILGMRAEASMIYSGPGVDSGGGIGAVLTLLTVQDNDGDEEGCVGWGGTADVVGPSACPTGLTPPIVSKAGNGDEKTGNSQTQTVLISDTGIASASSLTILLNVNEPAGNPFSITNLSLSVWVGNSATPVFNSGNLLFTPVTVVSNTSQGLGTLDGFAFRLDQAGQTALQSYWNASGARLGVAIKLVSVEGSQEVVRVLDSSRLIVQTPEPGSVLLSSMGLGVVCLLVRRKRRPAESERVL
jgi:hypothetical protein